MRHGLSFFVALAAFAASAQSHVVLEQPQAEAGSSYRAVFRVGHGCGDSPVTELVVQIPAGVRGARAMAKPGWQIETTRTGADVTQIRWRGGRLDPALFDDFVLLATLPDQPGPLAWKIVQVCENGRADWIAPLDVRPAAPAASAGHQH